MSRQLWRNFRRSEEGALPLLDKILFDTVAPRQVRYVTPPRYSQARGLARAALDQMDRDFVIGPPVTLHISNPELMTGMWSAARECLAAGQTQRARGEVIAATISRLNACPYCFDIHTSMLHSFGSHEAARAILRDGALPDTVTAAAAWARATLQPGSAVLAAPPFAAAEMPGIIGTAVCFHYLNRMVNIFLDGSALMLKGEGWLKGEMTALSGRMLRPRLTAQRVAPGEFLTEASGALPEEFGWAIDDQNIAGGFLRFAQAAEAAGKESVAPQVRACVAEFLAEWRGEAPPLGRGWMEQAVEPLGAEERPAARLALLAAVAPTRVERTAIGEFQARQPGDRNLINTTSWAIYRATRRIASWLAPGC